MLWLLILLHSEWPKLHRVLAILSVIVLIPTIKLVYHFEKVSNKLSWKRKINSAKLEHMAPVILVMYYLQNISFFNIY